MQIVIFGSGNVAAVLAEKLSAGNTAAIAQIVSRNPATGKTLAEKVKSRYTDDYTAIEKEADVYLVCVQDSFLPEVARQLEKVLPKTALVVHTAGSVSISVLENVSSRYGVLYPLQSLRKENSAVQKIPLLLDASTPEAMEKIQALASIISSNIALADDEQRIRFHVAAIFVSNFPNYLYTLMASFCKQHEIDFSFLLPLMEETIQRLHRFSPEEIQTGPAARGDISTIDKHKALLQKENPELLSVYAFMTAQVLEHFAKKN